jgi:diacylglycerol kinase family enzyme
VALVVNRTPVATPIAIFPLGTENLLARYLHLEASPKKLCQVIADGQAVRLDAGEANGQLFLLMLGCGFDAEVVRRMHIERTGHITHWSYFKPILDSIRTYDYPELRITSLAAAADSSDKEVRAAWAFVANLPRYAAGLSIVPDADGTDGCLDVCTFKEGSFLSGLMYLAGVVTGQHRSWSDCVTLRTRRLRIEADVAVPYQLDGDPGGYLPVEIQAVPQRLTLLVPAEWDGPA